MQRFRNVDVFRAGARRGRPEIAVRVPLVFAPAVPWLAVSFCPFSDRPDLVPQWLEAKIGDTLVDTSSGSKVLVMSCSE
jgi:hypothetical protein